MIMYLQNDPKGYFYCCFPVLPSQETIDNLKTKQNNNKRKNQNIASKQIKINSSQISENMRIFRV